VPSDEAMEGLLKFPAPPMPDFTYAIVGGVESSEVVFEERLLVAYVLVEDEAMAFKRPCLSVGSVFNMKGG
jgi:hypothetical protein